MASSVYKGIVEVWKFIDYYRKVCRAKGIIAKGESHEEMLKEPYTPNHYFHRLLEEDITPDQYYGALGLKSLIGQATFFSNTARENIASKSTMTMNTDCISNRRDLEVSNTRDQLCDATCNPSLSIRCRTGTHKKILQSVR